jgi:hypothetical protein
MTMINKRQNYSNRTADTENLRYDNNIDTSLRMINYLLQKSNQNACNTTTTTTSTIFLLLLLFYCYCFLMKHIFYKNHIQNDKIFENSGYRNSNYQM